MTVMIRPAIPADAQAMAALLNAVIRRGGTTAHLRPFDVPGITSTFIAPPRGICCFCAAEGTEVMGFQSLEWVDPDWPGPDRLPPGWAIIATYVALGRHREGLGRSLFSATRDAARAAGVERVDATIRRQNTGGQGYYARMGFVDYRSSEQTVSKVFKLR